MGVDYTKQYEPHQLEPFWPNELIKMSVAVLCTLAVIMLFVILPTVLEAVGLHGIVHQEEPAQPRGATPVGIKPEWYFLASYQFLKLMPTSLIGVGGKTLGVVGQGVVVLLIVTVPIWYRAGAHRRAGAAYRLVITAVIALVLMLTLWGAWPEHHVDGKERLVPLREFIRHKPLLFAVIGIGLSIFYVLVAREVRTVRRMLGAAPDHVRQEPSP